jgi:hypothetical protein
MTETDKSRIIYFMSVDVWKRTNKFGGFKHGQQSLFQQTDRRVILK